MLVFFESDRLTAFSVVFPPHHTHHAKLLYLIQGHTWMANMFTMFDPMLCSQFPENPTVFQTMPGLRESSCCSELLGLKSFIPVIPSPFGDTYIILQLC